MNYPLVCPKCSGDIVPVNYPESSKNFHYGVSELNCTQCDWRLGYFCGKELHGSEVEQVLCDGGQHPIEVWL